MSLGLLRDMVTVPTGKSEVFFGFKFSSCSMILEVIILFLGLSWSDFMGNLSSVALQI